jgi:hypothetical protein
MTTSHDSRFAGGLVLTTAFISWAGLGQAQDMEAVWGVWAGRVGNVEIRMCAQSDPDRPFDGDFAAIYTTQDYQIVLLDRVTSTTWSPRLAEPLSTTGLDDGTLRLEMAPAYLWSGVTLAPIAVTQDTEPCLSHAFNGPRTFLPEPMVTAAELDGVSYEVVSVIDPSGNGEVTTFQLSGTAPGSVAINSWLATALPKTAEVAPYYTCSKNALQHGAGSFFEQIFKPDVIKGRFIVVNESTDVFCGGNRPNFWSVWHVFDVETGKEIDTTTWIRPDAFYDLGPYAGQGPEVGDPVIENGFRDLMEKAFTATNPTPSCNILLDIVENWNVRPSRDGLVLTPSDDLGPGRACATELSFSIEKIAPYLADLDQVIQLFRTE